MLPIPGTLCMATWASQEDWVLGSGSDLVQKAWVVIHLSWIFQAPQERQPSHWTSQDGSLSTQHRFLINWAALQRRWRLCCWTLLVVRPSSCTWASEGGRARWALGQHVSNIYIYDTHNFAWFFTEIGTYTAVLTRVRVRVSWHNSMLLYAICPPLTRDEYRYMLPFWCSGPPVVKNLLFFWVINCTPIPLHRWPVTEFTNTDHVNCGNQWWRSGHVGIDMHPPWCNHLYSLIQNWHLPMIWNQTKVPRLASGKATLFVRGLGRWRRKCAP